MHFFVDAGELTFVEPDAAAFGTLVDSDLFGFGEPFAVEDLVRAARAKARLAERDYYIGIMPYRVQGVSGLSIDALKFAGVEPDTAAAAVTNIDRHTAGAFFT